ncbi:MAG: RecX family transcriptional regulator [Candidatus Microsaccharimonas sp.]
MKITSISVQQRDKNRVNVSIDGKYRFSLDFAQITELGIKVGNEYTEAELADLENESQFGKLYMRALEYSLMRPHSQRELTDYLYRKTRDTRTKTGAIKKGVSKALTERVYTRITERGYVNDEAFARYWVENRQLRKGISRRKLQAELASKGVDRAIVDSLLAQTERSDEDELQKIIEKRAGRYDDEQKLIAYLARQGFGYDDIKQAIERLKNQESD